MRSFLSPQSDNIRSNLHCEITHKEVSFKASGCSIFSFYKAYFMLNYRSWEKEDIRPNYRLTLIVVKKNV